MRSALPETAGSRRAALAVHALAATDREWVLQAMAAHHRSLIEPLLVELRTLGIPPDAAALGSLDDAATVPPGGDDAPTRLARLPEGGVAELARQLQREPPVLSARLLALRPWPWRLALRDQFDPRFAAAVEAQGPQRPAPALDLALCEALLRQLEARQREREVATPTLWSRSLAFIRSRGGWT